MAENLQLDIVSAEGELFSGEVRSVSAPAEMGEVGIHRNHAPLLTMLKAGALRIEDDKGEIQSFFVSGGILEVQPHLVTVMSDTAERAADIDEAAAEEARKRAEEALEQAKSDIDIAHAQAELAAAAARHQLVQKLKGKR